MPEAITPAQIRAGRALLDWSMVDLASAARVSVSTVKLAQDGIRPAGSAALSAIRDALETEGVRFLPDEGHGAGVRFKAR